MVGVAPGYPSVETPEGWTREVRGPRLWLVPPGPGGRIVIAPLQGRPRNTSPPMFLDSVLHLERDRFAVGLAPKPEIVTSAQHYPGLIVDLMSPTEHRCYALYASSTTFALLFLQSAPHRVAELRPVFLAVAANAVLPDGEPPPTSKLEPWDEL